MVKVFVYYDERYPSSWISSNVSKQIVEFIEKEGFEAVNADELKKVMSESIKKSFTEEIVVVFSQDIVPDTILDNPTNPTNNSLLGQFLNKGHSIIWLGDIPLLYVGFKDRRRQNLSPTACQNVLGLQPNPPHVNYRVSLTLHGLMYGLPEWIGTRPHTGIARPGVKLISLAESKHGNQWVYHSFILSYVRTLSGFIRLYDFPMNDPLDEPFLKALYTIAISRNPIESLYRGIQNLEYKVKELSERIETKFNTLKNELDNLTELIKKAIELQNKT